MYPSAESTFLQEAAICYDTGTLGEFGSAIAACNKNAFDWAVFPEAILLP